jgi:hypothetical protein
MAKQLTPEEFESYRPILVDVPGHLAGEVATISSARAREYVAANQAESLI